MNRLCQLIICIHMLVFALGVAHDAEMHPITVTTTIVFAMIGLFLVVSRWGEIE